MIISENLTTINEIYKYEFDELDKLANIIIEARENNEMPITRTKKSYLRELKAHKRLYNLHLFRKHTADCDLEENINKFLEILYFIIGF